MHSILAKTLFITSLFFSSLFALAESQPLAKLKVRFATDANYYPFEYFTEQKTIAGFDIDIAKAICEAVQLVCSFQHHRFDGLLLTLNFGQYDAVIAAMDITQERLTKVDFSDSYYRVAPVFISSKSLQGQFSLKAKSVGVLANSSNQNYLVEFAPKDSYIVPYSTSELALLDLQAKHIDVVFADFAVIHEFLANYQGKQQLVISRSEEVFMKQFSEGYGIAVKKGNHKLRKRLNKGLAIIKENGTFAQIVEQYFPSR